MPTNTDPAHRETERLIQEMERKLAKEYRQAYNDLSAKLDDYLRRFQTKDRIWRGWVADGTKTREEYQKWRIGQIAIGERWSEMKTTIAQDLHNVNQIARSTVNGYMPEVYAINHNYATYEVERGSGIDTSYSLYDRHTVERIMRDNPDLMPGYKQNSQVARNIAAGRDIAWNKQKIQSSMIQGILQGESIDKMAKRLQSVTTADYKSAVRYARTMSTSAQNAGRYAAYQRADDMGIDLTLVWTATLDERTRISHRFMDGEERDVNEPFSVDGVDIYYPGDLGGVDYEVPGYLIWNCRCTIIAQVKGFEYNIHGKDTDYSQIDGDYEDWKNAHESESEDIDRPAQRADEARDFYLNAYQNLGNSSRNDVQSGDGGGIINFANGADIFYGFDEKKDTGDVSVDGIAEKLEESVVGRHVLEYLADNNLKFRVDYGKGPDGARGSQDGDLLTVYLGAINSNRVGAQTLAHEVEHHEQGIGGCKLAEAICYAKEKMLKENRTFLYDDEWADMQTLAAKEYPKYPYSNETITKELKDYVEIKNREIT